MCACTPAPVRENLWIDELRFGIPAHWDLQALKVASLPTLPGWTPHTAQHRPGIK